jgi:hypothetical protein
MRDPVVTEGDRGGRPAHNATQRNRNRVTRMVAFGWADERIGNVLGITLPTLKKHYRAELKLRGTARDRLIVEAATTFWQQFQDGNTNAGKAFMALAERNDLAIHGQPIPTARPLGKKEQALRDAQQLDPNSLMERLLMERAARQRAEAEGGQPN